MAGAYVENSQEQHVGVGDSGAIQQLVALEDLLLLARYDEAAKKSADLVSRFSKEGLAADAFLQRALVTTFQAHFFIGRQSDVDGLVDTLGLQRLAVPTFMAWSLLLLESQQAAAARLRVEQYMSAVVTLLRERQLAVQPTAHGAHVAAGPVTPSLAPTSPIKAASASPARQSTETEVGVRTDPLSVPSFGEHGSLGFASDSVGAAAATPQDCSALARLYSQDVLCLGLSLPLEALRWLQPSPSPAAPACTQQQQQQQQHRSASIKTDGSEHQPACPTPVGVVEVVDACELVGSKEVLERLQEELKQLMTIVGIMPPQGLPDGAAVLGAAPAQIASAAAAAAGAGASTEAGANVSPGHAARKAEQVGGGLSGTSAGSGFASGSRSGVAPTRAPGNQPRSQASHVQQGSLPVPITATITFVRSLLAAVHAVARCWFLRASVQLTRAQTWLICKAAAVTSRLWSLSVGGGGVGNDMPSWPRGGSLGRAAMVVALAAMVLVAAQAEAPHLRTTLERQWVLLAGMVREAVRMGLALHPSPVATTAAIP